ncbi:MAG: molybdopterin-binding protein, partial [Bacillota bacterium]|nr:molybdopterin-binding protein [Bacillota bacterium]
LGPGDFAENITTEGIDLLALPVGTRLEVGPALLEVTQIGKECHTRCAIYYQAGDCVMPREGIFARVLRGGTVRPGDPVKVLEPVAAEVAPPGRGRGEEGPAAAAGMVGAEAPKAEGAAGRQLLLAGARVAVLTASDKGARGEREDRSGPALRELVEQNGGTVVDYALLPDEREALARQLRAWCDGGGVDLILTTGGTGFSPRDVTPEATLDVVEREVPGLAEEMRRRGLERTPHAMLSRGRAGIRGRTLIINLPGSPRAALESLSAILPALPHGLAVLRGEAAECGRSA